MSNYRKIAFKDLPPLKQWLIKEGFFIKKGEKNPRPYTHLLLDGGKIHIPREKLEDFRRKYAVDLMLDHKHFICETKTPVFKLLADLDFLEEDSVETERIVLVVGELQRIVYQFFKDKIDDYSMRVIICTTTPKIQSVHNYNYTKTGVHLIWPDITVNMKMALLLRSAFVQHLKRKYGQRPNWNTWEDVVDETVYKANGLRMIGSSKMSICKFCRGKKDLTEDCGTCEYGKIDEGRVYKPTFIIDGLGKQLEKELVKLNDDIYDTVLETSIVTDLEKPDIEFVDPLPDWFDEITYDDPKQKTKRKKRKQLLPPGKEDLEGSEELRLRERIDPDEMLFDKVVRFIRTSMPKYRNVEILDIHKCADGDYYVARTDCRFCMNIDREHNSNTIYFYIDKNSVYQKCFCRCDTDSGRKFGKCRDYRSSGHELSKVLKNLLYPEEKGQNAIICYLDAPPSYATNREKAIFRTGQWLEWLADDLLQKEKYEKKYISPKRKRKIIKKGNENGNVKEMEKLKLRKN